VYLLWDKQHYESSENTLWFLKAVVKCVWVAHGICRLLLSVFGSGQLNTPGVLGCYEFYLGRVR